MTKNRSVVYCFLSEIFIVLLRQTIQLNDILVLLVCTQNFQFRLDGQFTGRVSRRPNMCFRLNVHPHVVTLFPNVQRISGALWCADCFSANTIVSNSLSLLPVVLVNRTFHNTTSSFPKF